MIEVMIRLKSAFGKESESVEVETHSKKCYLPVGVR